MYESIQVTVEGIAPLMLHNGQLANPLNPIAKAMKEVSGKRKKTDSDYAELSRLEFLGGLYVDENKRPVFPGENIEAAMIQGAKRERMGPQAKAGIICDGLWPIEYEGPKTAEELSSDDRFKDVRKVKIQKNSVMRTRPIFRKWKLSFVLSYLPSQMNKDQVKRIIGTVGQSIGIGDFIPKFGRFQVMSAK